MRGLGLLAWVASIAGCSDYALVGKGDDLEVPPTPEAPEEPPPVETPEVEEPPPPPPVEPPGCDEVYLPWTWRASDTFQGADDPADAAGVPFWHPSAATGWPLITLPDRSVPTGDDRAYVATFELSALPANLSLNLQSDDGLWVWVNGTYVGNWGGAWQEEGCVNENAECLVTIQVDPIDVTDLLVVGTNTLAARVSNPVANAYFEILPECALTTQSP